MVRENWKSLNGLWEYAVTDKLAAEPERYEGEILVPFAIESALSGWDAVTGQDAIWYKTAFTVPKGWNRVKLNFEAVDWKAEVFVGACRSGHTPAAIRIFRSTSHPMSRREREYPGLEGDGCHGQ